jgi:hypothetical protein
MVASLTHESMRRVSDLVELQPDHDPYEVIKAGIQSALQLTGYQRADKFLLNYLPLMPGSLPR